MLYRRLEPLTYSKEKKSGSGKSPRKQKVRFYFWLWALAPNRMAENYYYTITVPREKYHKARLLFYY